MAITQVAGQIAVGQGDDVASQNVAFPSNVVAGNFLCVPFAFWAQGNVTVTVTDTRGTNYSILLSAGSAFFTGTSKCGIAYGVAPSSGANTVTITPSTSTFYVNVATDEFTASQAMALDVNGGESTGTSTTPSDALTTLSAGDLVVGAMIYDDPAAAGFAEGSGYTLLFHDPLTTRQPSGAEFKIAGAAGAEAPNWVLNASSSWRVLTAAFKESVVAGPPAMPGGVGLYSPRGTTQPVARGWA